MSLKADELIIRKHIVENVIAPIMPAGGRVIPAPVYFSDKEDYWATIESVSYTTQKDIEDAHVMYCAIYFLDFVDIEGPKHSPLFGIEYELDVFSQYDSERTDENISPDAFNKKMLLRHNEFVGCILDLKEVFQGEQDMGLALGEPYAIQRITSLVQTLPAQNRVQTEFIPGITGHRAKFKETVKLQLVEC